MHSHSMDIDKDSDQNIKLWPRLMRQRGRLKKVLHLYADAISTSFHKLAYMPVLIKTITLYHISRRKNMQHFYKCITRISAL